MDMVINSDTFRLLHRYVRPMSVSVFLAMVAIRIEKGVPKGQPVPISIQEITNFLQCSPTTVNTAIFDLEGSPRQKKSDVDPLKFIEVIRRPEGSANNVPNQYIIYEDMPDAIK